MPLKSFEQLNDERAGNLASTLAPPQGCAYLYLGYR